VSYGNGHYSTGASHASTNGTGLYNIYITSPDILLGGLAEIGATTISITNDGPTFEQTVLEVDLLNLWQDKWTLLATVPMTSGNTYTVTTSTGGLTGLVAGQVIGGIMFEPIPEPSTYAAIFGGLVLVGAFVHRSRSRAHRSA